MRYISEMRVFILSGGDGARLAPLPAKQFLALTGEETLIQQTARRVARYAPLTVIANRGHRDMLAAQLPDARAIYEPAKRGTAAAAAIAALSHGGTILLLPSDHAITDEDAFHRALEEGVALAEQGYVVTFGIPARTPETDYGYIERDGARVTRFVEKPPVETARDFVASGKHSWNSGMFLFKSEVMREELRRHAPGMLAVSLKHGELDEEAFLRAPNISLDHAVMEKTDRAAVVACDFGWSDVGSWPALWRFTRTRKDVETVERPWGRYTGFAHGDGFQLKEIVVNAGARISLQRHKHRREHWIVMAGRARVTCDDHVFDVDVGGTADIPLGAIHRLENPGDAPLHIVEVQFGDYLGEDDIERFSDDYGRA